MTSNEDKYEERQTEEGACMHGEPGGEAKAAAAINVPDEALQSEKALYAEYDQIDGDVEYTNRQVVATDKEPDEAVEEPGELEEDEDE